ncbi:MAG: Cell division protein FtsI/penicillin-binding protein 2, partial [Oscillospiraceae bacterium]|nr:Cell division protein FtsI/penicillin-binding protein 2 [Oscillospiraceae bacterium]
MVRPKERRIRLIILSSLIFVIFVACCARLMQFQIVEGSQYRDQANKKTISTVRVKAARGEIVDRYGRPLATNKVGFNIIFDRAFMATGTENEIIAKLKNIMDKAGEEWVDTLPITKTKPYKFEDKKESDVARAKKVLGLNSYATAQNCIDELIEKFKITGYDEETKRMIASVRFEMLQSEFSLNNRYTFAEDIATATVAKIKEQNYDLKGVDVIEEATRDYVSGTIAPHIIGTLGPIYAEEYKTLKEKGYQMNDVVGKDGIEKTFESYLRGTDGIRQVEQNARGDVVSVVDKKSTVPGNTVMLTIDKYFQQKVQNILADHIKWLRTSAPKGNGAKAGAVAVLDAKTGEVLALATYPSYNIKDYRKKYSELATTKNQPLFNRTLWGTYRPGSTYKTSVATAALCEGVIGKGSTVYCNHVYTYYPAPFRPKCTGYHGSISVVNALKFSCNIFFYDVGRRVGIDTINEYSQKLGLGVPTGLEIPNATGVLASPAYSKKMGAVWNAGNVVQASIGQLDTAVTPLQMAIQAATLANDGTRYEAHLIKSVQSYNYENIISQTQPKVASKITGKTAQFDIVTEGMKAAASRLTGSHSLSRYSFDVAIKTGTPQTATNKFNSAVIGFAPADEPEIAIAAIIEDGE